MLFDEFTGEHFPAGEHGKPPWPPAARSGLDAAHEVALAYDAQQLAVPPDHRHAADAGTEQCAGHVLYAGLGANGNDIRHHHVGGFHGTAPSWTLPASASRAAISLIFIKTGNDLSWLARASEQCSWRANNAANAHRTGGDDVVTVRDGNRQAQEVGRPGRGLELAQRLCAECHAVRKERTRSPCRE